MPANVPPPADAPRPAADVVVIGAGMAGLAAAGRLAAAGLSVTVVDKGRGVGGRLATRRMGDARLDHGAQFFTSRSDDFGALVGRWVGAGVARQWCLGFRHPPDGHPRYVGVAGMTSLAKDLAGGLDVRVATRVEAIGPAEGRWLVSGEGGSPSLLTRAVLATAPVPQTLALLDAGATALAPATRAQLEAITYSPTLAALVVPAGDSAVPDPGGVQLDNGLLSWVGDNAAKGVSPVPAVTLHASAAASAARWDEPAESVLAELLGAGAAWLGGGGVQDAQLMRWRYAQPTASHDARCLVAVDGPAPLVCAGDAFGEARVEGAALSGWAAADALLLRLL